MGTSGKANAALMADLVMAVVLLGTCALGAYAALRVQNNLNSTLTILHPPGCCSSCVPAPGEFCPEVCEECPNVKVKRGQEVTLDSHVGPYPLPGLRIRVRNIVYCVPVTDLYRLTATAVIAINPGRDVCPNSFLAFFIEGWEGYGVCLQLCRRH